MGGDIRAPGEIRTIQALTLGTDTIRALALVRNHKVDYTTEPATKQVEFEYTDHQLSLGENFYHVRALQTNDEIAWSSPIREIRD